MLTITNKESFTTKLVDIMSKRLDRPFVVAQEKGYNKAKEKSPHHGNSQMKDRLRYMANAPQKDVVMQKGISFTGLDSGRKDALKKMQTGWSGDVPTNTKAMRDWLEGIGKSHWVTFSTIKVGRSPKSRFYGGNKNPMQFARNEMKSSIEKDIGVQFK